MNLENSIKDCITKEIEKGVIEKVIAQKMEECVASAVKDMFSWGGEVKKVIEEKIKSVMIPYLESYDYSEYILKLDTVLVDVLKNTALENKKLVTNFKDLMIPEDRKVIKVSELFELWKDYVAKNVDTDDLDIDYDDGVSYNNVEVSLEIDYSDSKSWSIFENGTLTFECEHDENMNFAIPIQRWKDDKDKSWDIRYDASYDIKSLRRLNNFSVLLMRLNSANTKLEIDTDYENDEVEVEAEPEASFS